MAAVAAVPSTAGLRLHGRWTPPAGDTEPDESYAGPCHLEIPWQRLGEPHAKHTATEASFVMLALDNEAVFLQLQGAARIARLVQLGRTLLLTALYMHTFLGRAPPRRRRQRCARPAELGRMDARAPGSASRGAAKTAARTGAQRRR